ncbi:MAG: hypothetical protein EZS28_050502 [Streblomastix strix]|uniref:Uncharacterized protein n=1 Tax=Streblomastix strix TaxID=222440 RepID=A0A5J4T8Y2_9EUKA|nr:MAG: hypothetical protein EZS28_050502 [Streblomastix strix]
MWKLKGSQRKLEKLCRVTRQESSVGGKVHIRDELEKELGGRSGQGGGQQGNQTLQPVIYGAEERRQMEEGVGQQEVERRNGQNTLQDGGSSIGREESESVHGFQFRQQEFYVRRNAFWVNEEPCNFLQCAEAGDQGDQRKMESERSFLQRRYSAYGLGQGKAWKVYFGSNEVP